MIKTGIKYSFILVIGVFFFAACKKKDIPPLHSQDTPVFLVDGTLDGEPFKIEAGIDDAYMHAPATVFNNVPLFHGLLMAPNNTAEMILFNHSVDKPESTNIFNEQEQYSLADSYNNEALLSIQKTDFIMHEQITSLTWIVNDESYEGENLLLYEPGSYEIEVNCQLINGENIILKNNLIVGYKESANATILLGNDNESLIAQIETNQEPASIFWFLDDNPIGTADHVIIPTPENGGKLTLEVLFSNGTHLKREAYVSPEILIEDFTQLGSKTTITWDNTVLLRITKNGKTYQSIKDNYMSNILKVFSVKDFTDPIEGKKAKLLKGKVKCKFMELESEEIVDGELFISLGLGY